MPTVSPYSTLHRTHASRRSIIMHTLIGYLPLLYPSIHPPISGHAWLSSRHCTSAPSTLSTPPADAAAAAGGCGWRNGCCSTCDALGRFSGSYSHKLHMRSAMSVCMSGNRSLNASTDGTSHASSLFPYSSIDPLKLTILSRARKVPTPLTPCIRCRSASSCMSGRKGEGCPVAMQNSTHPAENMSALLDGCCCWPCQQTGPISTSGACWPSVPM
mmetsp:Transcript_46209/g.114945  ORF Transcript_46209/g.114945 Transcript_46209/m.114945 type:complete len:215 (+) Transcript_46209:654-1298(+)